jgi:hypothetical protein
VNSASKPSRKVHPNPRNSLAPSTHLFQWVDLLESETLVFTKYQKYQKTRSARVPEVPENQKHQSINPLVKFEGVKFGFSKI